MDLKIIGFVVLTYLLGSIPSAYIMGRAFAGLDITQHGSGNVGGTNALRVLGMAPAILVALIDISKAFMPAYIANRYFEPNSWPIFLTAFAAIVGHNYSIYLKGRGGKGIATTIGAGLALFPHQFMYLLALAILVVVMTRYVSLGSLSLVLSLPLVLLSQKAPLPSLTFSFVVATLGVWRHRSNIRRLLQGRENKLGKN